MKNKMKRKQMMAINWSKQQQQAITSINTNELVNAGAGSGKTAVLSEHVIYLLENGYQLNEILIMTFTNLAANEMKQRIKKKIDEKPNLRKKFSHLVDSSHIETFDAFALFLVRKYHYLFDIEKNVNARFHKSAQPNAIFPRTCGNGKNRACSCRAKIRSPLLRIRLPDAPYTDILDLQVLSDFQSRIRNAK